MIEGLKIKVGSEELKQHLQARSDYHKERAEFYDHNAGQLREGGLHAEAMTNDPINSLEKSSQSHRERSAFFSFMAEHIIPSETYILTENDLTRIELVSRYF